MLPCLQGYLSTLGGFACRHCSLSLLDVTARSRGLGCYTENAQVCPHHGQSVTQLKMPFRLWLGSCSYLTPVLFLSPEVNQRGVGTSKHSSHIWDLLTIQKQQRTSSTNLHGKKYLGLVIFVDIIPKWLWSVCHLLLCPWIKKKKKNVECAFPLVCALNETMLETEVFHSCSGLKAMVVTLKTVLGKCVQLCNFMFQRRS